MNHIKHRGKSDCGVCVVATITGATWEEAAASLFPGKHNKRKFSTTTKDVVSALWRLGYLILPPLQRVKSWDDVPPNSIVKVHSKVMGKSWHWVVYDGEKVIDSVQHKPVSAKKYEANQLKREPEKQNKVKSYLGPIVCRSDAPIVLRVTRSDGYS